MTVWLSRAMHAELSDGFDGCWDREVGYDGRRPRFRTCGSGMEARVGMAHVAKTSRRPVRPR
jgi:hypothetical protein